MKAKKALIEKLKKWKASKDEEKDLAALDAISEEWTKTGFVPKTDIDKTSKDFSDVMNKAYGQMNIDDAKQIKLSYGGKIKQLLTQKDALRALESEKRSIRERKTKLNDQKVQLETNLAFFSSSKGDNPMLKDAKGKIDSTIKIMEELDLKTKFLNVEMNRIKKEQLDTQKEESTTEG